MKIEIKKGLDDVCSNIISETNGLLKTRSLFKNNRSEILNNLVSLENHLNLRLLNFLSYAVFDQDDEVAKQSSILIYKIIKELTYKEIKLLDGFFRISYDYYDRDFRLNKLDMANIESRISKLPYKDYVLCILTMSGNGYIREFGVRALSDSNLTKKMSFIALRLNDWVDHVRIAANESLNATLQNDDGIEMLLEALPLFDHFAEWKKSDFKKLEMRLNTALYDIKNRDKLVNKYRLTKDYRIKRSLFKVLFKIPELQLEIVKLGIRSKDPVIIKACLKSIEEGGLDTSLSEVIPLLRASKYSNCVILYCHMIECNDKPQLQSELMTKLIYHRSSKVREYARNKLMFMDESIDILKLYRQNLYKNGILNFHSYQGFSEICGVDDFDFVKTFVKSNELRVVRSTLQTLNRLDFEASKDILLDFLCSEMDLESRTVRRILSSTSSISKIGNDISEILFFEGFEKHVYYNILDLLDYAPKWLRINTLLKFAESTNGELLAYAIESIRKWNLSYNRSFIKPTLYEKEEFLSLFEKVEKVLDDKLRKEIGVVIKDLKHGI